MFFEFFKEPKPDPLAIGGCLTALANAFVNLLICSAILAVVLISVLTAIIIFY